MAQWVVGDTVSVLGLPTGANSPIRPEWLTQLRDRHVSIVFDADTAGWKATDRWVKALVGIAGGPIRIVQLAEGTDVCKTPVDLLRGVL